MALLNEVLCFCETGSRNLDLVRGTHGRGKKCRDCLSKNIKWRYFLKDLCVLWVIILNLILN